MQLFLSTILLASGFSLQAANSTGGSMEFLGRAASLVEEQSRAATPRRLTHRRTVDGALHFGASGGRLQG